MITRSVPAGAGRMARVVFSSAADGDFCVARPPDELAALRSSINGAPWTWLEQVHGCDVVAVGTPGEMAGVSADAAVTRTLGCVLAIHTADCAPVVIVGNGGVGVAHAGWRGIVSGVIPATFSRLQQIGVSKPYTTLLGPCIRPGCYEFGPHELDVVAEVVGESVRATTSHGKPALDMGAAVHRAVSDAGAGELIDLGIDTSDPEYFSHRSRSDNGRQATVAWLEEV